jgi:hypothetical protein
MTVTARKTKKKPPPQKRGPKPDRLKIEGDWKDAVRKAIRKPKPQTEPKGERK